MVKRGKEKQQTLETTLHRSPVRPTITSRKKTSRLKTTSPQSTLVFSSQITGSGVKRGRVISHDSSLSESSDESDDVVLRRNTRRSKKHAVSASSDGGDSPGKGDETRQDYVEEESEDDRPLVTPKRKRPIILDDSDDDEDEQPPVSPIKRRRLVQGTAALTPASKSQSGIREDGDENPVPSSTVSERTRRRPLTQKERKRELLRRRRAGEVIHEDEESSTTEEEPVKALYDSDSEHLALSEFEDDSEGVLELDIEHGDTKKKQRKDDSRQADSATDSENDLEDFIVDDGNAPIGNPDVEIPYQLTMAAHKSLKEQFDVVIEWLVNFKIDPGFPQREDEVYRMAWGKLDDEVRGLAQSKFASSAWKKDFYLALRARPLFTSVEGGGGGILFETQDCAACGRSNHPATYTITFTGDAYYKNASRLDRFLTPVPNPDVDDDENEEQDDEDEDEDGNVIPKQDKQWPVGAVCNSNAETAHALLHWKNELLEWVDTRLHEEGYMVPSKVAKRKRMSEHKLQDLTGKILHKWMDEKVVKQLYVGFKNTLEQARNKPTVGRRRI